MASNLGLSGRAGLRCQVGRSGQADHCQLTSETPEGVGFGASALAIAHQFRVDPASAAVHDGAVDLPIGFTAAPNEGESLAIGPWIAAPTFADVGAVYPDIGGGVTGQVFMRCTLERDGGLRNCKARYQRPPDRDFDTAAVKLAHLFRMRIDPALMKSHQTMEADVTVAHSRALWR